MISQESLPEGLLTRCLDVLRVLVRSEKELIRIVVEVVHELRDADIEELPVRAPYLHDNCHPRVARVNIH